MLDSFVRDFEFIFTAAGTAALIKIIIIDIVMSGDNAILIGMATKKLKGEERKKAIFYGVAGATVLRIFFSIIAVWLMSIPGVEFLGAILLLYVVWKFYREIRSHEHADENIKEVATLSAAIKTIIIADVAMSLDNVLAVAGNAEHNYAILMIGLVLSILLMVTLSGWIANLLDRYPSIQWLGLFVILFTALKMLEVGFGKVSEPTVFGIPESSIFMLLLIIIVGGFAVLQAKYLKTDHSRFAEWAGKNGKILMVSIFLLLIVTMNFGGQISAFVDKHHEYQYGFIMICVLGILEILRIEKDSEKHNLLRRLFSKGE